MKYLTRALQLFTRGGRTAPETVTEAPPAATRDAAGSYPLVPQSPSVAAGRKIARLKRELDGFTQGCYSALGGSGYFLGKRLEEGIWLTDPRQLKAAIDASLDAYVRGEQVYTDDMRQIVMGDWEYDGSNAARKEVRRRLAEKARELASEIAGVSLAEV